MSWATNHDKDYIQNEVRINPDFLKKELIKEGVWQNYYTKKDRLKLPDRARGYITGRENQSTLDEYRDDESGN